GRVLPFHVRELLEEGSVFLLELRHQSVRSRGHHLAEHRQAHKSIDGHHLVGGRDGRSWWGSKAHTAVPPWFRCEAGPLAQSLIYRKVARDDHCLSHGCDANH